MAGTAYFWVKAESRVTQIDTAVYAQWQETGNPKANYYTLISDPPGPGYTYNGTEWVAPPVYTPQEVTRFQAKAVMLQQGILDSVEQAVDASSDALLKLAWDEALTFERQSPALATVADTLGLTEQQLDDMFTAAAQVKA